MKINSKSNSKNNSTRILEKIKTLEAEKAKLLKLRKEEIFNVLDSSGGLTLDNRLLTGLAIYASNPANADSSLLKELFAIGQKQTPSKRNRNVNSKADQGDNLGKDSVCAE